LDTELLSPREREVASLTARGHTREAIAEALVISRRTAHTHAAHIRDKLGVRSRAEDRRAGHAPRSDLSAAG
jgi:DNA-binding CsgD family transcriptional regulator